jgi:hypothetical protein
MKDFHAGFLFFNCSFLCRHMNLPTIASLPKETNQRKGSRSLGLRLPALLAKNGRLGKSRSLCPVFKGAPPSRFFVICCAARLHEMAL